MTTLDNRRRIRKFDRTLLHVLEVFNGSRRSWYLSQSNVDRARAIVKQLANTYKESSVVTAIAVLNECVLL